MLILSEMAGAAAELKQAIIINPNNIDEIEEALLEALKMPEEEKKTRMDMMRKTLSKQTVKKWADDFTKELASIKEINLSDSADKCIPEKSSKAPRAGNIIIKIYSPMTSGFNPLIVP